MEHCAPPQPLRPISRNAALACCALLLCHVPAAAVGERYRLPRRVCPRGLAGPSCDQLAWPACAVGAIRIGCDAPAPCACAAQCDADWMLAEHVRACYNTTSPPASIAAMMAAPLIVYARQDEEHEVVSAGQAAVVAERERWGDPETCPQRCNDRGFCSAEKRCESCFKEVVLAPGAVAQSGSGVAQGKACEALNGYVPPCLDANCSGGGTCVLGVCLCTHGNFGAACELPALQLASGRARARPAIYVYHLPPAFNMYAASQGSERNTGWWLWRALLTSPHRTLSPHDADFFFVPCFPMDSQPSTMLLKALRWVRNAKPHWNATRGHNHLVVGAWDFGLAQIAGRPEFSRLIQLSHFGYVNTSRNWQTTHDGRCPTWLGGEERERVHRGGLPDNPSSCRSFMHFAGANGGPHRPGIDIIIPDTMEQRFKTTPVDASTPRTTRVFFSGGPTNVWREDVHRLHGNASGWHMVIGHVDLLAEMTRAVFCLDVGGGGFSTRFTLAMVLGCIPVYLDELEQPWAGELPQEEFSVRFAPEQLPMLPAIIDALHPEKVQTLQAGVRRWRSAYHWRTLLGADGFSKAAGIPDNATDAFETLMRVLLTRVGK